MESYAILNQQELEEFKQFKVACKELLCVAGSPETPACSFEPSMVERCDESDERSTMDGSEKVVEDSRSKEESTEMPSQKRGVKRNSDEALSMNASQKTSSGTRSEDRQAAIVHGGAVPIPRPLYNKTGNLVGGSKMTCMPDAASMVISDLLDIQLKVHEARNVCMPNWLKSDKPPTMKKITDFYNSKGLEVSSRSELISNPRDLFRQKSGVYHLILVLSTEPMPIGQRHMKRGDGQRHAAVFNADQSVLKDNQQDVAPVLIEDSDKQTKEAARRAIFTFWPSIKSFELTQVFEIFPLVHGPKTVHKGTA